MVGFLLVGLSTIATIAMKDENTNATLTKKRFTQLIELNVIEHILHISIVVFCWLSVAISPKPFRDMSRKKKQPQNPEKPFNVIAQIVVMEAHSFLEVSGKMQNDEQIVDIYLSANNGNVHPLREVVDHKTMLNCGLL